MLPLINSKVITPHKFHKFPCSKMLTHIEGGLYTIVVSISSSLPNFLSRILCSLLSKIQWVKGQVVKDTPVPSPKHIEQSYYYAWKISTGHSTSLIGRS